MNGTTRDDAAMLTFFARIFLFIQHSTLWLLRTKRVLFFALVNNELLTNSFVYRYPLRLGANELVQSLVMRDLEQVGTVSGEFVVRWDGDGVLGCEGLDVGSADDRVRRGPQAGVLRCDVQFSSDFNNGLSVQVLYTNPLDPVRNVRAFLPGFDEGEWAVAVAVAGDGGGGGDDANNASSPAVVTDAAGWPRPHGVASGEQLLRGPLPALPFHPHLLQFLEPLGSHLRFMDWMRANEDAPGDWAERPDVRDRLYVIIVIVVIIVPFICNSSAVVPRRTTG